MRRVSLAAALVLLASLLSALTATTAPSAGAVGFCDGATHTWVGAGDGNWSVAANWSSASVPGTGAAAGDTDVVCIAQPGVTVTLNSLSNTTYVRSVLVGADSTLRLIDNGKLRLRGDQATAPSIVEGRLQLFASASIAGPGLLRVNGTMVWQGGNSHGNGQGASTISSDECWGEPTTCLTTPGRLEIAAGGTVVVNGNRGVNLLAGYQVVVDGTLRMEERGAYVSADTDTAFEIGSSGLLDITNDGGIYEGFASSSNLADLTNAGTLRKDGGGVSLVAVNYHEVDGGQIVVVSGSLSLPHGSRGAVVRARGTLGTGSCPASTPAGQRCVPTTSSHDPEYGRVSPARKARVKVYEGNHRVGLRKPLVVGFGTSGTARIELGYWRANPNKLRILWASKPGGHYSAVSVCRGAARGVKRPCIAGRVRHTGGAKVIVRSAKGGSFIARKR